MDRAPFMMYLHHGYVLDFKLMDDGTYKLWSVGNKRGKIIYRGGPGKVQIDEPIVCTEKQITE